MFLNQKRIIDLTELCDLKKLITMPIIRVGFPDGYAKAGQRGYLEGVVRWATDYFIKCHVSDHEFYAQVSADMLTLLSVAVL